MAGPSVRIWSGFGVRVRIPEILKGPEIYEYLVQAVRGSDGDRRWETVLSAGSGRKGLQVTLRAYATIV